MSRLSLAALVCFAGVGLAHAQQKAQQKQQASGQSSSSASQQQAPPSEQSPPEEDESLKPKVYAFNPLQAEKELRVGNYYFHKGSYRAAADRFLEATKWNAGFAEAYVRLGEADEKQRDWKGAREAYEKFLQIAAEDKRIPEVRKKLEKLAKEKR